MKCPLGISHVVLVVKNPPANARDIRDMGSIPRLVRFPGVGNGNSLQYPCLENPHGQRGLEVSMGSPWGQKELGMTEVIEHASLKPEYDLYHSQSAKKITETKVSPLYNFSSYNLLHTYFQDKQQSVFK